jgi:hypothetical protein
MWPKLRALTINFTRGSLAMRALTFAAVPSVEALSMNSISNV